MKGKKFIPTYELVRELFDYRDGMLFWKVRSKNSVKAGDRAGCLVKSNGYRVVGIKAADKRRMFSEHRLIYLWHHGYYPENDIDHINRCRDDNRIENLREVSRTCNMRNCSIDKRNITGVTGVRVHHQRGKLHVRIGSNGKLIHIGYYDNLIDAAIARWNAEVEHNYPGCNSTSSAYQYLLKSGEVFFDDNGQAIKRISQAC